MPMLLFLLSLQLFLLPFVDSTYQPLSAAGVPMTPISGPFFTLHDFLWY